MADVGVLMMMAGAAYVDAADPPEGDIVVGFTASGGGYAFALYYLDPVTGYGANFAPTFATVLDGLRLSRDANMLVGTALSSSPYVHGWPISGNVVGSKFANPGTLPNNMGSSNTILGISPDADKMVIGGNASPYINLYAVNPVTGFGAKASNPASLPNNAAANPRFSPSGNQLVTAVSNGSPYMKGYPLSGATFGAAYANPATLPGGNARAVAFSPSGDYVAIGHASGIELSVYPFNAVTGYGARLAGASPTFPSTVEGVEWRTFPPQGLDPGGDVMFVVFNGAPYIRAYAFSGGAIGTVYPDPASPPTANPAALGRGLAVSDDGKIVITGNPTNGWITYTFDHATGWGSTIAAPTPPPGAALTFTSVTIGRQPPP